MKAIRIPLQPHSHFHFGEFKVDSNVALSSTSFFAHSDTLFSAITNICADINENVNNLLTGFKKGEIKISSLFYYLKKENEIVYLFPKPVFLDLFSPRDGNHKLRGKVKLVSLGVWENSFDTKSWTETTDYKFIQNQEIVLTSDEFEKLGFNEKERYSVFKIVDLPKNPIRKNFPDEAIYYQADVEISEIVGIETGFFFLYDVANDFDFRTFKKVLNIVLFTGIGGEKNNTGRILPRLVFENEEFLFKISTIKPGIEKGYTNLSLLMPQNGIELKSIIYAQTLLRGGRKTGVSELQVIRMIKEGALLESDEISGNIAEIGIDQNGMKVLRYGKPIIVPLMFKSNHE